MKFVGHHIALTGLVQLLKSRQGLVMLRAVVLVMAMLGGSFHATSSWAAPIKYTVDIDWSSGALSRTSSQIELTLDGLQSTGSEVFTPFGLTERLVSFEVWAGGSYWTLSNLITPNGASVQFFNGELTGLNAKMSIGDPFFTGRDLSFNFGSLGNEVTYQRYFLSAPIPSSGEIDVSSFARVDPVDVPAPATIALFGLGLVGLSLSQRKRKARS